jgi:hypothetical protein
MPIELRSRINPQSYSNATDAVLAYHELGIGVVTLGSHVTSTRDAELRAETLRLIKQAVAGRDAATSADRGTTAA